MIRYNLQFFAKDGPGGEKTEPASGKKLDDARKKGQVAKSKDLTGSVALLAAFIVVKVYAESMGNSFIEEIYMVFRKIGDLSGTSPDLDNISGYMRNMINLSLQEIIVIVLPFFAVAVVISIVLDVFQVKWKPTAEPIKPKLEKISPVSGFKRIFSTRTLVNFAKSLVIIAVCGLVVYLKLRNKFGLVFNLYEITLVRAISEMANIITDIAITLAVIYLIVGIIDYIFEFFKFRNDMKMTKQEVKDEWKNTEGDPEIKGKQKRRMQEASRRRMMSAVQDADVVITNPTHFAVALKYDQFSGKAPVVIAKGEDYLALKIKEKAKEHDVEIVENKQLARMLYYNVDLDQEIPPELYQAVAEILAFVYKQKHKI